MTTMIHRPFTYIVHVGIVDKKSNKYEVFIYTYI